MAASTSDVEIFIKFKILDCGGWDSRRFYIERGKGDPFEPEKGSFYKDIGETFHTRPSYPGRLIKICPRESAESPTLAVCIFSVDSVLTQCYANSGGRAILKYDLDPTGTLSLKAQVHPHYDRTVGKRDAKKHAKAYVVNGHQFMVHFFREETTCAICNMVFWGFQQQGLKCNYCELTIHKNCPTNQSVGQRQRPIPACPNRLLRHQFQRKVNFIPRRCECGDLIWPFHAYKCSSCQTFVHEKCLNSFVDSCSIRPSMTVRLRMETELDYDCDYDYIYTRPRVVPEHGRHDPWLVPTAPYHLQNFNLICRLGLGGFGKVYLAQFIPANADRNGPQERPLVFALKALRMDVIAVNLEVTVEERKVLLLGSGSPFLLHMFCTFKTESHLFYVVEFLAGGTVMRHIQDSNNARLDVQHSRFYAAEVVCALEFLHGQKVIYRDLKADNVMLTLSGHVKLIDFGLAKELTASTGTTRTICGTVSHIAPEIVRRQPYTYAVDWWSFGAFIYEMLVGLLPFQIMEGHDGYRYLERQYDDPTKPPYDDIEDQSAIAILQLLFERDPTCRLGSSNCPAGSVRQQPFFESVNWAELETGNAEPPALPRPRFRQSIQLPDTDYSVDVSYFDDDILNEQVNFSHIDDNVARTISQNNFRNFSLVNFDYQTDCLNTTRNVNTPTDPSPTDTSPNKCHCGQEIFAACACPEHLQGPDATLLCQDHFRSNQCQPG